MLSREQRNYTDTYAFKNGMYNIAYVSGQAQGITPRGGYIQQTRNLNHLIPFTLEGSDRMPGWVRDGAVVKIIARVTGRIVAGASDADPKAGVRRECVLRALAFERPSVLEMPPEAAWAMSVPKGAPISNDVPANGMYGLPFSKGSNDVQIAGHVSGIWFRKGALPGPDGKRPSGCLHVLIQQTPNSDDSIPVRCYGRLSEALERHIKLGSPILIQNGEIRIDIKETGVIGPDGLAVVTKFAYIKSQGLHVATRDHILEQYDWARALAKLGMAKRDKPAVEAQEATATERPALKVVSDHEVAATEAVAADGQSLSDEDLAATVRGAMGGHTASAAVG